MRDKYTTLFDEMKTKPTLPKYRQVINGTNESRITSQPYSALHRTGPKPGITNNSQPKMRLPSRQSHPYPESAQPAYPKTKRNDHALYFPADEKFLREKLTNKHPIPVRMSFVGLVSRWRRHSSQ